MPKIAGQLAFIFVVVLPALFSFQNCSKMKFAKVDQVSLASATSTPVNPICNSSSRPQDSEYIACLPPKQNVIKGVQRYNVVCQNNGTWARTVNGNADYSLCSSVCDISKRLSDKENVACPAPFANEIKGVQSYVVSCLSDGNWSRTISGPADYVACSKSCDMATKPPTTSSVLCPAPFNTINSGIQNYAVTCNANGTWARNISGAIDYKNCPQSCDPTKMPTAKDPAKCPTSTAMNAFQFYSVTCSVSGTWIKTPTGFDSSGCAQPATCNPATKPPLTEAAFCSSPNQTVKSAIQSYAVTCSGTNWVQVQTSKDESACPKNCTAAQPANSVTMVACQSPYQTSMLAKQSYKYVCNTTSGGYDKTATGSVDYSGCPKSCSGAVPSTHVPTTCPSGMSGTAYQNYTATCNISTGSYDLTPLNVDNSGCAVTPPQACVGPQPPNFDAVACPSPFASRSDAKQFYSVSCTNGNWIRVASGSVDTSSCPVNDCTGSPNPGTQKIIGACPGRASGSITQTCSLTCTGNTYTQGSCSANDYAACDCGANATFNTTTKSCVATGLPVCTAGSTIGSCKLCTPGGVGQSALLPGVPAASSSFNYWYYSIVSASANGNLMEMTCNAAGTNFEKPGVLTCKAPYVLDTSKTPYLASHGVVGDCVIPATPTCTTGSTIGSCKLCNPGGVGQSALLPGVPPASGSFNYWYYSIVSASANGNLMEMTCNSSGTNYGNPGVLTCKAPYVLDTSKSPYLATHGVVGDCVIPATPTCTTGSTIGSCKLCTPGGVGQSALLPGVPAASSSFNYWYYSIVSASANGNLMEMTCNSSGTNYGNPGVLTCKAPYVLDTSKTPYLATHGVVGDCVLPSTDVYCPAKTINVKSGPNIQGAVNYCTLTLPKTKWGFSAESTIGPLVAATVVSGDGYSTAACQKDGTWMSCTPGSDGYCIGDGREATACTAPAVSLTWQMVGNSYHCSTGLAPDISAVEGTACSTVNATKDVTDGNEPCPGNKGFIKYTMKCK